MVRPRKSEEKKVPYEGINETSVEQDYNGLWFVLNYDGFPISPAFKEEGEAVMWKRNLI